MTRTSTSIIERVRSCLSCILADYLTQESVDEYDDVYTFFAEVGKWLRDNASDPKKIKTTLEVIQSLDELSSSEDALASDLLTMEVFEYMVENSGAAQAVVEMMSKQFLNLLAIFLIKTR